MSTNTPWPNPPMTRDINDRHPNSSQAVTHAETRLRWERDFARRVAERLATNPGQINNAIISELRAWKDSAPPGGGPAVPDTQPPQQKGNL